MVDVRIIRDKRLELETLMIDFVPADVVNFCCADQGSNNENTEDRSEQERNPILRSMRRMGGAFRNLTKETL